MLAAEEANLLQARRLARTNRLVEPGVRRHAGPACALPAHRPHLEWARLVDELVPDLVDPATDGPRARP